MDWTQLPKVVFVVNLISTHNWMTLPFLSRCLLELINSTRVWVTNPIPCVTFLMHTSSLFLFHRDAITEKTFLGRKTEIIWETLQIPGYTLSNSRFSKKKMPMSPFATNSNARFPCMATAACFVALLFGMPTAAQFPVCDTGKKNATPFKCLVTKS